MAKYLTPRHDKIDSVIIILRPLLKRVVMTVLVDGIVKYSGRSITKAHQVSAKYLAEMQR